MTDPQMSIFRVPLIFRCQNIGYLEIFKKRKNLLIPAKNVSQCVALLRIRPPPPPFLAFLGIYRQRARFKESLKNTHY